MFKCYCMVYKFSLAKNSVNLTKNYYKVLQLDASCDQKAIKKSYLKLVKQLHPDVNPTGKQKFTQVQQAYDILSNQQLKKYYDQNMNGKNPNNAESSAYQPSNKKTSSGYEYYTYRTYSSQRPNDYYNYSDKNQSYSYQSSQKAQKKEDQQFKQYQQRKRNRRQQQEKKARARAAYQQYMRQKRRKQQETYRHETQQQKKMRDKVRHMKGFASPYNQLWGSNQMRYSNMTRQQKQKRNARQLKAMMPEKVRNYYEKIISSLQKMTKK